MLSLFNKDIQGVGINLRLENIDEVLSHRPKFEYLEIIPENWFDLGPHHKKLEKLRADYKILFHCVGMNIGGEDTIDHYYLDKVIELKNKFEPIHISDHLAFQSHQGRYIHDLLPITYSNEKLKKVSSRIHEIQEKLKETIQVENLTYYIEFLNSSISQSQFLNQLHSNTGCGFLLDLTNLWTNEKNLNVSSKEYLNEIKHSAIKEIHIAGSKKVDDIYIDSHTEDPVQDVIDLLPLINTQNIPLIYERDGNFISCKESFKELKRIKAVMS